MSPDATGNRLYAWQSEDSPGTWSIIAMMVATPAEAQAAIDARDPLRLAQSGKFMVLVARDRDVVESWEPLARAHSKNYGQAVRLATFSLADAEVLT